MNLKIKFELEETELKGEIENLIPSSSGGSLPSGGTTGQVLTKNSNADGDAGWSTPEPFVINSGEHYNQLFVNKSYAEIKEAYESGKNVVIIWNNKQYPLSSISDEKVEFVVEESITNSDDYTMYNIHTRTLAIYSESGKRATKDYINLNVYSINGCDKLFAPKASAVLTTEQTLTTEQQSQALSNVGGLSKNQGIANSGKFLGIGADGIVVPTEVGGGSSDISFPLLYEATMTEEVRWIDTGANAFRAKRRLIIQLISKATQSNSTDNSGCGSIYTDGSPISSAYANYVLTNGMTAMLPKQYDRLNTFYGYRVNDDASWIFYHTNRTVVNAGSTALNCANQNSAVSKKDITGFIIGDNSAAVNNGTRVFGIGTEIKVWGV